MKSAVFALVGVLVLVSLATAFPGHYRRKLPVMPVPFHPVPYYQPGFGPGPYNGLTLLTSAALLGSGIPAARALGGLGLLSLF